MTHTVNERQTENLGSIMVERWELDITSLDAAGEETSFEPTEANVTRVAGVVFIGQENTDYAFTYDKSDGHIHVSEMDTNAQVTAGTDVGEVELLVLGK